MGQISRMSAAGRGAGLLGAGGLLIIGWTTSVLGWVAWSEAGRWIAMRAPALLTLLLGLCLVGAGGWLLVRRRRRGPARQPRSRAALSWWVVAAALLVVVVVSWATTVWLLGEAAQAQDIAAARVEAIKTGLGIGAGTGGVFALLLAVRRQWHQELTSVDTTLDATERRVTELYTSAVELLESEKAPVRMGGLYALERLAQVNPTQRRTVVNVLCAYLRMPYNTPIEKDDVPVIQGAPGLGVDLPANGAVDATSHPLAADDPGGRERRTQEREVRLTAQRILAAHLRPGPNPEQVAATFWPDCDLDLSGAALIDFDFSGCYVRAAVFADANFSGSARFVGTRFAGPAVFKGANFAGSAAFGEARFAGQASFGRVSFIGSAGFNEASFAGSAGFVGTRFAAPAAFDRARFGGSAAFDRAGFAGFATFDKAAFSEDAAFRRVSFSGEARFGWTLFSGKAIFEGADFSSDAVFLESRFSDIAVFEGVTFTGYSKFTESVFSKRAIFRRVTFLGVAVFRNAHFGRGGNFSGTSFARHAEFGGAQFIEAGDFMTSRFMGPTDLPLPLNQHLAEPDESGWRLVVDASVDPQSDAKETAS